MKHGKINAINLYRIGHWAKQRNIPLIPRITEALQYIVFKCIIPTTAEIGSGTYCSHRGISVVLHRNTSIGKNCTIGTCVTLGGRHDSDPGGPIIGNNVYIGTGAKIIGPVKIGDGAKIGANAVVLSDVPENRTAVGIPAKITNVDTTE